MIISDILYVLYRISEIFMDIHGVLYVYDIIAVIKQHCALQIMLVAWSFKRQIDGKFRKFSFCAVYEYSSLMRLYHLVNKGPKPEAPFLRLRFAAAARSYLWKMTFWSASDIPRPLSRTFRMV